MDDVARLVAAAEAQGWLVDRTRRGHLRLVAPDPTAPTIVTADGGGRGVAANLLASLRAAGLAWPPRAR